MKHIDNLEKNLITIIENALECEIASSISFALNLPQSEIVIHRGYTHRTFSTSASTIYDLASLTKILGTTLSIAYAVDRGLIDVNEIPFSCWPHVTVKRLLEHRSGLPAHLHFYKELSLGYKFKKNLDAVRKYIFNIPIAAPTSLRCYSDLGFIALGFLLEQRYNLPLSEIFTQSIKRTGLNVNFFWCPSRSLTYVADNKNIAPTGYSMARNQMIHGQVHDDNCYFIGGLHGHAGLFGTLQDVHEIGKFFLNAALTSSTAIENILAYYGEHGIGFDKPSAQGSNRHFSMRSYGHFGYTGVSLWMEPRRKFSVALLTNRVAVSHDPSLIFYLRFKINQAIVRAYDEMV